MQCSFWRQLTLGALCAGLWAGCARTTTGYRISEETVAFVQPGATTRADLIENLGPPLFELLEPHVVAYSWGKAKGVVTSASAASDSLHAGPSGPAGTMTTTGPAMESMSVESRRWLYCVALDASNHVIRSGKFELEGANSLEAAVRQWAASGR